MIDLINNWAQGWAEYFGLVLVQNTLFLFLFCHCVCLSLQLLSCLYCPRVKREVIS